MMSLRKVFVFAVLLSSLNSQAALIARCQLALRPTPQYVKDFAQNLKESYQKTAYGTRPILARLGITLLALNAYEIAARLDALKEAYEAPILKEISAEERSEILAWGLAVWLKRPAKLESVDGLEFKTSSWASKKIEELLQQSLDKAHLQLLLRSLYVLSAKRRGLSYFENINQDLFTIEALAGWVIPGVVTLLETTEHHLAFPFMIPFVQAIGLPIRAWRLKTQSWPSASQADFQKAERLLQENLRDESLKITSKLSKRQDLLWPEWEQVFQEKILERPASRYLKSGLILKESLLNYFASLKERQIEFTLRQKLAAKILQTLPSQLSSVQRKEYFALAQIFKQSLLQDCLGDQKICEDLTADLARSWWKENRADFLNPQPAPMPTLLRDEIS